jgi:ketosteroid isomerase-like protein
LTTAGTRHLDTIVRYYDGCSLGDIEMMTSTLHPEVVHYFLEPNPGSRPIEGAQHLAKYWRKVQKRIDGRWIVDHVVSDGSQEAVVEWSLFWRRDPESPRIVTRGSEWFDFTDGLIKEIRSYYQQLHRHTGLRGYPYGERGYSVSDSERSRVHAGLELQHRDRQSIEKEQGR